MLANGDRAAVARLHDPADIAGLLSAGMQTGGTLLVEGQLGEKFFDLGTGLAGELFQKFTQYRVRLALVIPAPAAHGPRFNELAYEHRAHPSVRFFSTEQLARQWLAYNPVVRC